MSFTRSSDTQRFARGRRYLVQPMANRSPCPQTRTRTIAVLSQRSVSRAVLFHEGEPAPDRPASIVVVLEVVACAGQVGDRLRPLWIERDGGAGHQGSTQQVLRICAIEVNLERGVEVDGTGKFAIIAAAGSGPGHSCASSVLSVCMLLVCENSLTNRARMICLGL